MYERDHKHVLIQVKQIKEARLTGTLQGAKKHHVFDRKM